MTEDGKLHTEYLNSGCLNIFDSIVDYNYFCDTDYKSEGYQAIIEISKEEEFDIKLIRQNNWIQDYLTKYTSIKNTIQM